MITRQVRPTALPVGLSTTYQQLLQVTERKSTSKDTEVRKIMTKEMSSGEMQHSNELTLSATMINQSASRQRTHTHHNQYRTNQVAAQNQPQR